MPAGRLRVHAGALLGYVCVALVFSWPLPLHLGNSLPGPSGGDTGVYVWNLWVFRHEILVHHTFPFATLEILTLDAPAVPLTLHNYTTFANVLAFPLIGLVGLVATFNVLVIGSGVLTAYAMFVYAWKRTGDAAAAFVGGLLFGFSPYMTARATAHFSLVQAAPLPIFGMLMLEIFKHPSGRTAAYAGLVVAWAFLCDPYYAVYCLMIALYTIVYSAVVVERRPESVRRIWWPVVLNLAILCVGGLIVGVLLRGGGRVEVLGLRVSVTRLYTPVLVFIMLLGIRAWLALRPQIRWGATFHRAHLRAAVVGFLFCAAALAPVLYAMASPLSGRIWAGPKVHWRSSAPGIDVAAWFIPNPLHPWFGNESGWLSGLPNGLVENVASVPWIAAGTIAFAAAWGFRGTVGWWLFTGTFALLSLGPFVHVAGINTYVPTPWALLRYLPVIGAARMPTRMTVLVMLGVSMLLALAVLHIRNAAPRRHLVVPIAAALLVLELMPAPRPLFSAAVPDVYRVIAVDPRPVRVVNLPFGLKDGLSSRGGFSTAYQYYQTVHEKRLLGGYLSRLPGGAIERYRRHPVVRVLLRLSEGRALDPGMAENALAAAPEFMRRTQIGYVVVDTSRSSPELIAFAHQAFSLTPVASDGSWHLYRTPVALPLDSTR